jgi:hypothetical protein
MEDGCPQGQLGRRKRKAPVPTEYLTVVGRFMARQFFRTYFGLNFEQAVINFSEEVGLWG